MSKYFLGIHKNRMSTGRTLIRYSVFIQFRPQIFHLFNPGFEVFEFSTFIQSLCQSIHIPARHSAIGNKPLVHDTEHLAFFPQLFAFECYKSTHIHNRIFFRRHGHDIGIREHFFYNLFDGFVFIPFFPCFNEISILCKTGRIDLQVHSVLFTKGRYFPNILHRYGLTSGGIIRNGQYDCRDLFFGIFFQYFLQLGRIHVAFKRNFQLRISCFVDSTIDSQSFPEFNMSFRSIEMGIARQHISFFDNGRI